MSHFFHVLLELGAICVFAIAFLVVVAIGAFFVMAVMAKAMSDS